MMTNETHPTSTTTSGGPTVTTTTTTSSSQGVTTTRENLYSNLQYRPPSRTSSRGAGGGGRLSLNFGVRASSASGHRSYQPPPKEKPNYLKFVNNLGPGLRSVYYKEDKKLAVKDNRPLKDPKFQQECIRNLLSYLHQDGTMPEIKKPDFKSPKPEVVLPIFKTLYLKFFPRHEFGTKLAYELGELLARLGYPYLATFPKNISPIGSYQNWPHFLGLLDWMTRKLKVLESYELDPLPVDDENFIELECDQFYDSRCLTEYSQLSIQPDLEDQLKQDLLDKHDLRLKTWEEEINELQESKLNLMSEYETMKNFEEEYFEHAKGLEHDKKELRIMDELYPKLQDMVEKREEKIKLATTKIEEGEGRIMSLQERKREIEEKIRAQPISIEEFKTMQAEEAALIKATIEMAEKITANAQYRRELEKELAKVTDELESARDGFISAAANLGLNDPNLPSEVNLDLQLELRAESPHEIVTIDLWGAVKETIQKQKNGLTETKHALQSQLIHQKMTVDQLVETELDRIAIFKEKAYHADGVTTQYETIKKQLLDSIDTKQAEIKLLEENLLKMNVQLEADLLETETLVKAKEDEINHLTHHATEATTDARHLYHRLLALAHHLTTKITTNLQATAHHLQQAEDKIHTLLTTLVNKP